MPIGTSRTAASGPAEPRSDVAAASGAAASGIDEETVFIGPIAPVGG